MALTELYTFQIGDKAVVRGDLNVQTPGSAVITKLIPGAGISLSSSGADTGTGDVTVNISTYTHVQTEASSIWIICHNLGKFPSITIIDSDGDQVEGDVSRVNMDVIKLTFSIPIIGTAYLS